MDCSWDTMDRGTKDFHGKLVSNSMGFDLAIPLQ